MFGYVTPLVPELRVKEYDLYKAVYCGLCRQMGSRVCTSSRLTLSYDFVFLALFRTVLTKEPLSFSARHCAAHPFRKRSVAEPCESLRYSAAASALLICHKILDDLHDAKGPGKLPYRLLLPAVRRMRRRAALPELDETISRLLGILSEKEAACVPSLDETAELFGKLLGACFSYGLEDARGERIAYEIGFHTGKWIYMADAADDLPRDKKSGSYNPLIAERADKAILAGDTEALRNAQILELRELSRAAELIDYPDSGIEAILKNIIYLGMPARFDKICERYPAKDSRAEKGTFESHE